MLVIIYIYQKRLLINGVFITLDVPTLFEYVELCEVFHTRKVM